MTDRAITTEKLSIGYRNKPIMTELSLSLPKGKVTGLIGKNGVGKSTLLKTITGELPKIEGEIWINDAPLGTLTRRRMAKEVAVVTTEPDMAGGLKVEELVGLGRIPYTGAFGRLSAEDKKIVEDAMTRTGIISKRKNFIGELSDGERQKVMIARGLAQATPVLIMDEPFSFLDVASRIELLELLRDIADKEHKTILFSTHEVTQSLRMLENVWICVKDEEEYRIVEGKPEEVIRAGFIDMLFDNKRVIFNRDIGDFEIKQ